MALADGGLEAGVAVRGSTGGENGGEFMFRSRGQNRKYFGTIQKFVLLIFRRKKTFLLDIAINLGPNLRKQKYFN